MNLLVISLTLLLIELNNASAHVIPGSWQPAPTSIETPSTDIYEVQENNKTTVRLINPKQDKLVLREIFYYHVIEKAYGDSEHQEDKVINDKGPYIDETRHSVTNAIGNPPLEEPKGEQDIPGQNKTLVEPDSELEKDEDIEPNNAHEDLKFTTPNKTSDMPIDSDKSNVGEQIQVEKTEGIAVSDIENGNEKVDYKTPEDLQEAEGIRDTPEVAVDNSGPKYTDKMPENVQEAEVIPDPSEVAVDNSGAKYTDIVDKMPEDVQEADVIPDTPEVAVDNSGAKYPDFVDKMPENLQESEVIPDTPEVPVDNNSGATHIDIVDEEDKELIEQLINDERPNFDETLRSFTNAHSYPFLEEPIVEKDISEQNRELVEPDSEQDNDDDLETSDAHEYKEFIKPNKPSDMTIDADESNVGEEMRVEETEGIAVGDSEDGDEEVNHKIPEDVQESEVIPDTPEVAVDNSGAKYKDILDEKIKARNLLFESQKERYQRKRQLTEKSSTFRRKRQAEIPEAPRLPNLNYDSLPEYIRKPISTEITMPEDVQESEVIPDIPEVAVDNSGAKYTDNIDEPINTALKSQDYKLEKYDTNNEEIPFKVEMEDKIEETPANLKPSDSEDEDENDNKKPRTYGMNLTGNRGYVWNDLWSDPGISYDVGSIDEIEGIEDKNKSEILESDSSGDFPKPSPNKSHPNSKEDLSDNSGESHDIFINIDKGNSEHDKNLPTDKPDQDKSGDNVGSIDEIESNNDGNESELLESDPSGDFSNPSPNTSKPVSKEDLSDNSGENLDIFINIDNRKGEHDKDIPIDKPYQDKSDDNVGSIDEIKGNQDENQSEPLETDPSQGTSKPSPNKSNPDSIEDLSDNSGESHDIFINIDKGMDKHDKAPDQDKSGDNSDFEKHSDESNRFDDEEFKEEIEDKIAEMLEDLRAEEHDTQNKKPNTYGMNLSEDHGYVWNDLWSDPGISYDVGNIDKIEANKKEPNKEVPMDISDQDKYDDNTDFVENKDESNIIDETKPDDIRNPDENPSDEKLDLDKDTEKVTDQEGDIDEFHIDQKDEDKSDHEHDLADNEGSIDDAKDIDETKLDEVENPSDENFQPNKDSEKVADQKEDIDEIPIEQKDDDKSDHEHDLTDNEGTKDESKGFDNKKDPTEHDKNPKQDDKNVGEQKPNTFEELMKNEQFWKWLAEWTSTYMELLNKHIHKIVNEEVSNQMKAYLESHKDDNTKSNKVEIHLESKEMPKKEHIQETVIKNNTLIVDGKEIPITHNTNFDQDDLLKRRKEKDENKRPILPTPLNITELLIPTINDTKLPIPTNITKTEDNSDKLQPIRVNAQTIIGNSVGNDKVTNIFIFYNNKDKEPDSEEIKEQNQDYNKIENKEEAKEETIEEEKVDHKVETKDEAEEEVDNKELTNEKDKLEHKEDKEEKNAENKVETEEEKVESINEEDNVENKENIVHKVEEKEENNEEHKEEENVDQKEESEEQ